MLEHLQSYNSDILKWVLKRKNIQKSTYFKRPMSDTATYKKTNCNKQSKLLKHISWKISEPSTRCSKEATFLRAMVLRI